jgi:hypothetical protein
MGSIFSSIRPSVAELWALALAAQGGGNNIFERGFVNNRSSLLHFFKSWREIYSSQRNNMRPVCKDFICFHMGTRSTKKVEFPCALIVLY